MKHITLTISLFMLAIGSSANQFGFSLERQFDPNLATHGQKGFIGVLTQSGLKLDVGLSYREEKNYRYQNTDYWGNDFLTEIQFSYQLPIGLGLYIEPLAGFQISNWEFANLGQSFINRNSQQYEYGLRYGAFLGAGLQVYARSSWKTGLYEDANGNSDASASYAIGFSYYLPSKANSLKSSESGQNNSAGGSYYLVLPDSGAVPGSIDIPPGVSRFLLVTSSKRRYELIGPFSVRDQTLVYQRRLRTIIPTNMLVFKGTMEQARELLESND